MICLWYSVQQESRAIYEEESFPLSCLEVRVMLSNCPWGRADVGWDVFPSLAQRLVDTILVLLRYVIIAGVLAGSRVVFTLRGLTVRVLFNAL